MRLPITVVGDRRRPDAEGDIAPASEGVDGLQTFERIPFTGGPRQRCLGPPPGHGGYDVPRGARERVSMSSSRLLPGNTRRRKDRGRSDISSPSEVLVDQTEARLQTGSF